jgi:hypothetical protein
MGLNIPNTKKKNCLSKSSPTNNGILVFENGGELYSPWEIPIFLLKNGLISIQIVVYGNGGGYTHD